MGGGLFHGRLSDGGGSHDDHWRAGWVLLLPALRGIPSTATAAQFSTASRAAFINHTHSQKGEFIATKDTAALRGRGNQATPARTGYVGLTAYAITDGVLSSRLRCPCALRIGPGISPPAVGRTVARHTSPFIIPNYWHTNRRRGPRPGRARRLAGGKP